MDRPHGGPAGPARTSGATVTANLPAAAEPKTANLVEARSLHLSFGSTPALRGASLGVRQGEIVAVMGPSGSGKSTLLHCLAGILVPEEGQVWFGGQRLDTLSDDRRSALRPGPVMDLLTAAAREHGTTVILVTHDARVAAYADREVVVRDGKVSTLTGAKP